MPLPRCDKAITESCLVPVADWYAEQKIWVLLQILYGNLAPEGCVAKITGKEGLVFEGPAKVYDSEEDMLAALSENPAALKVPSSSHIA